MPGGWMPQATRPPFVSSIGVHAQAGRRSPRRTGSPLTALETWLGFVLYFRKVTTWKEHINYKRPGLPGGLLAQHSATPWGMPEACYGSPPAHWGPRQCMPSPPSLRLCASEAGNPGTHVLASPRESSRSAAQTEGLEELAQRAAPARAHGNL